MDIELFYASSVIVIQRSSSKHNAYYHSSAWLDIFRLCQPPTEIQLKTIVGQRELLVELSTWLHQQCSTWYSGAQAKSPPTRVWVQSFPANKCLNFLLLLTGDRDGEGVEASSPCITLVFLCLLCAEITVLSLHALPAALLRQTTALCFHFLSCKKWLTESCSTGLS